MLGLCLKGWAETDFLNSNESDSWSQNLYNLCFFACLLKIVFSLITFLSAFYYYVYCVYYYVILWKQDPRLKDHKMYACHLVCRNIDTWTMNYCMYNEQLRHKLRKIVRNWKWPKINATLAKLAKLFIPNTDEALKTLDHSHNAN